MSIVPGEGPIPAYLMFIAEAPGRQEAQELRPFVPWAPAGKELERLLRQVHIERSQVYITNLVKEHNLNDKDPSPEQIAQWAPVLESEIQAAQPHVLVTLGRFSTRYFLGDVNMEDVHGIPQPHNSRTVFPIYHPAAGLHNPEMQALITRDFQRLHQLLIGSLAPRPVDKFPTPSYQDGLGLTIWAEAVIAVDTEGSIEKPWGLSYSRQPGQAIVLTEPDHIQRFRDASKRSVFVMHNALHDLQVLENMGIQPWGFTDTMLKAYLLCLEPQSLKSLARRHLGMKMGTYMGLIGPAQEKIARQYFDKLRWYHWPDPTPRLTWKQDGTPHVKTPHSLVRLIKRTYTDLAKNPELDLYARWKSWDDEIKAPAIAKFGDMREAGLDDVPRAKAVDYAARDADATLRLNPILDREIRAAGLNEVLDLDLRIMPMVARMQKIGIGVDVPHFRKLSGHLGNQLDRLTQQICAVAGEVVNPGSDQQMEKLLFKKLGLRAKKKTKSGARFSVANNILEPLKSFHPVVKDLLDYREAEKLKGTYCDKLPQWVGSDGRIHAVFRMTRIPSGRLSCNNPNLLAIPTRSQLGRQVREGFIPAPGRIFSTWDLNQIEMRVMAHESQDDNMIDVFKRGVDLHAATAATIYGIPADQVTSTQRTPAKNVSFGVIFEISPYGLMLQMHQRGQLHWTEKDCKKLLTEWFKVYPGVARFMDYKKAEARRLGYVKDMFGRRRYLPGVHSTVAKVKAEAERQAVNHPIQAGAQGIIKLAMQQIWEAVLPGIWAQRGWVECLIQIHDELMFELDEALFGELNTSVLSCMQNAKELRVPIKAEGGCGRNWGALK